MAVNDFANDVTGPVGTETQSWRDDSLCRKHPTHWWFAGGHSDTAHAKSICSDCVVRAQCLEFALSRPDLLGIWGATTPSERVTLRRGGHDRVDGIGVDLSAEAGASLDLAPVQIDLVVEQARESREPDPLPKRSAARGPRRGWRDGALVEHTELLTPAEAARKLGVTPNTVTRWSRAGKISAIQTMGGHRRFRRSEIERVLNDASLSATNPY